MRLFHPTTILGLLLLTGVYNATAQDTIRFSYDEEEGSLIITFPQKVASRMNDSSALYKKLLKEESILDLNNAFNEAFEPGWIAISRPDKMKLERLEGFDSATCASLVFFAYTNNNFGDHRDINRKVQTPVKVTIIHKPNAVVVADNPPAITNEGTNISWVIILAAAVILAVLVVTLIAVRKHKATKRKGDTSGQQVTANESLEVVELIETNYVATLSHVRETPAAYYDIDLTNDFVDTAVRHIYLHHTTVKKMYDFFKESIEGSDLTNETGCYFVGCWEYADSSQKAYNISLEEIVLPGDDIVPGEFSFSFGLKIGVKLQQTLSNLSGRTGRDFVHTVWMHSHPGLGLFLSSHDLLVQQQLTYPDAPNRLVAFVIDTNTPNWELAIFSAKTSGEMNNKEDLQRLYSLDTLYEWSRQAHTQQGGDNQVLSQTVTPTDESKATDEILENYYAVHVKTQTNKNSLNVYLSGKSINQIDDSLYDTPRDSASVSYLSGSIDKEGNYLVDACEHERAADANIIGLFLINDKASYEALLRTPEVVQMRPSCIIISRTPDEMWVSVLDPQTGLYSTEETAARCSMRPLKEWLRRRRTYK